MNSRLVCLAAVLFAAFAPAAFGAAGSPRKILVVTVTTGFRHASIPTAEKVLAQMAERSGKFTVEFVQQPEGMRAMPRPPKPDASGAQDPAALKKYVHDEKTYRENWIPKAAQALQKLSPANLKKYDAVIFASTTGDLPLPDRQGFLDWVAGGKGFIGIHAATDTFHGFPPYIQMIGGEFKTHGPQVSVDCINQDPAHAACHNLPKTWTVFDEIYEFKNFERARVHGLLTLDRHPQTKLPGDHPVAWTKSFGRGRIFYTSLGHREDVWDPAFGDRKNPPEVAQRFQEHLLGGILWALGIVPGS